MTELVPIVINDQEYQVQLGARLIDVIQEVAQEEVPRFCYHRDLPVVGSCRMCQVEVEAPAPGNVLRKALAISCRTPVARGMKVWTQSPAAQKARRGVLEFLLKDHPLDCPICDKAGECPLQDYSYREGQSEGRSNDPRRQREKRKPLGEVIVLDQERCVLCSRCVRFFPAVEGREQLQVLAMGNRSVIGTFDDRPLTGNYQGNLADICPVGALTLKKFRFQARVWNTRPIPTACTRCSRGCAIKVDAYRGRVVRIQPQYDAAVNKSWMCDLGRFAFDDLSQTGRLATAILAGETLEDLGVDGGAERAGVWLRAAGASVLLVASPYLTLEEGRALLELAQSLGTRAYVLLPPAGAGDGVLHTGDPCPNRRGLTELGLQPIAAEELRARLAGAQASLLAGEKILHFLHDVDPLDHAAALPPTAAGPRGIVLDTHPRQGFALCLPARTWVEKNGTVRNLQGLDRRLRAALPAPYGVPDGAALLRSIAGAPQGAAQA